MKRSRPTAPRLRYPTVCSSLAVACLLLLAVTAVANEAKPVSGRVVDADGKPVAKVRIATMWDFKGDTAQARWRSDVHSRGNPEVRSDGEGRFTADLYFRGRPIALCALDLETSRGALAIVSKDTIEKEHVLSLQPLVNVHGSVEIDEPAFAKNSVYIYAFDPRAPIAFTRSILDGQGAFSFRLPPGSYKFTFSAKELQRASREVEVSPDTKTLDMGAIALSQTNLAEHYGKPPPAWKVTEARGVSSDVQLSDYRGRWVLLEFWSYW